LKLYEGVPGNETLVGAAYVNSTTGSASFTGLNRYLPQSGGTKTYTVKADLASVGPGANDTGGLVNVNLDGYKYRTGSSTTTVTGLAPASYTGNDNRVVAAYPTVTKVALSDTEIDIGNNDLYKFTIQGNGGNIAVYKFVFSITLSSGVSFASGSSAFKLYEDDIDITSLGSFATASYNFGRATGGTGEVGFTFTTERVIGTTAKTYRLVANVDADGSADGKSISTKLANPSTSFTTDDAATVAGTLGSSAPGLVWSDKSANAHSTSTDDWMNEYLVKTMGDPQTIQETSY